MIIIAKKKYLIVYKVKCHLHIYIYDNYISPPLPKLLINILYRIIKLRKNVNCRKKA